MKFLIILLITFGLNQFTYADKDCKKEAIKTVAKLSTISAKDLSVMGSFRSNSKYNPMLYIFVADIVEESQVYEIVMDVGSPCFITKAFYRHPWYTDEVDGDKLEELSFFFGK